MTEPYYYIGLMSGTSMDGVNAAIASFHDDDKKIDILATHLEEIPASLKNKALQISLAQEIGSLIRVCELDSQFGVLFAQSVQSLLKKAKVQKERIVGIGSHGQTLWHHPHPPIPFTLQIGDPNIIAKQTGIVTVADFRRGDMALGGQGAPLVPPFHQWVFGNEKSRIVLNIGGIANITLMPLKGQPCIGFDTGPGNGLMDAWVSHHLGQPFDKEGEFAKQGKCSPALLQQMLQDHYFKQKAPKSTGKDYFNLDWLKKYLAAFPISPADVQATLVELTATTISNEIQQYRASGEILICGGGVNNPVLITALENKLHNKFTLVSTEQYGVDPNWVEAICFAWFAKQRLDSQKIDLCSITGASRPAILGGIYAP